MTTETLLNITDHLNDFVEEATQEGISDIAFSPAGHPRARLNGIWKHYKTYHRLTEKDLLTIIANTHQSLNEEAKVRAALSEHQRLNYSTVIANWNFRINVGLTNGMPFLVMRVISRNIPTIDDLGLLVQPQRENGLSLEDTLKNIVVSSRGLVIVTGATGSGKSTTLAAMIRHFNDSEEGHIITIEDPIEFIHREHKAIIHQRLVGPNNDTPTFLDGVEDAMRQAPDIILLGEVRDKDTMTAALQAAETGHLVFCTLHTRDAPTTMQRVLGFYGAGEKDSVRAQFANSLVAIISQQLVKRTQPDRQGRMRQLIMEVLQPDLGMRSVMRDEKKPIQTIRDAQKSSGDLGNVTMDDQLLLAAQQGIISNEQAVSRSIMRETVEKALKDGRVGRTA